MANADSGVIKDFGTQLTHGFKMAVSVFLYRVCKLLFFKGKLVGLRGFEPPTPCTPCMRNHVIATILYSINRSYIDVISLKINDFTTSDVLSYIDIDCDGLQSQTHS